jgi:hypothetical protein
MELHTFPKIAVMHLIYDEVGRNVRAAAIFYEGKF